MLVSATAKPLSQVSKADSSVVPAQPELVHVVTIADRGQRAYRAARSDAEQAEAETPKALPALSSANAPRDRAAEARSADASCTCP